MTAKERLRYCEQQYRLRLGSEHNARCRIRANKPHRIAAKKQFMAEYRSNNRKSLRLQYKEYYTKNRDSILNRMSISRRNRKKTNPNYKIACNLRSRMSAVIKRMKNKKMANSMELIGCSAAFLKEYLEQRFKSGMTWDNYSLTGWHIDHIKPCSSFDLSSPESQKLCFHYTNLQPLWAFENLSKNDSW